MHRAVFVGCVGLLALGCTAISPAEDQGDSQSHVVTVPGEGRVSVLVSTKKGTKGVVARVTVKCGAADGRDNLAGVSDEEGILFPIVRPDDCRITATIPAGDAGKDTVIELHQPGQASYETVLSGSLDGYTTTATFGEPIP